MGEIPLYVKVGFHLDYIATLTIISSAVSKSWVSRLEGDFCIYHGIIWCKPEGCYQWQNTAQWCVILCVFLCGLALLLTICYVTCERTSLVGPAIGVLYIFASVLEFVAIANVYVYVSGEVEYKWAFWASAFFAVVLIMTGIGVIVHCLIEYMCSDEDDEVISV